MLKKIVKFIPFVSIILFILMFIGMTQADCVTEGVNNYCNSTLWTSNSYSFGMSDILAMFGHVNGSHLSGNALALLVFAVPAEILLGKRRFVAGVVLAMVIQVIIGEVTQSSGLGASGWLMAMPGLMLGASMWRIRKEGEESDYMSVPSFLFGTSTVLVVVDVVSLGGATGVDHLAHISGFLSGLIFVIAGLPFLAMTFRDEYREYERQIMLHRKRQIDGSYLV